MIEARAYTVFDTPFTVDGEREYIIRFPARGVWKVALDADRVVGFQVLEPGRATPAAFDHVASLGTYVDLALPAARRRQSALRRDARGRPGEGLRDIFTFVRPTTRRPSRPTRRRGSRPSASLAATPGSTGVTWMSG